MAVPSMTWIRVEVKGILWKAKIGIVEIMATMYVFVVVFPLSSVLLQEVDELEICAKLFSYRLLDVN